MSISAAPDNKSRAPLIAKLFGMAVLKPLLFGIALIALVPVVPNLIQSILWSSGFRDLAMQWAATTSGQVFAFSDIHFLWTIYKLSFVFVASAVLGCIEGNRKFARVLAASVFVISIVLFVLPGILAARLENPLASIFPIMVPAGIAYLGASLGASAPVFQKFSFPNWLTPALYGIGLAGLVSIWGNLVQNIPDVFASNAGGGILGVSFTISASGLSSLGHMFSIGWVQPSPRNLFFIFSEASILMAGAYVVGRSLSNTFDVRSMVIGFIAFIGFPDLIFTILGLPFFGFAIPSIVKVALTLVFTLMVLSFVRAGFASRSALVAPFIENRNRS